MQPYKGLDESTFIFYFSFHISITSHTQVSKFEQFKRYALMIRLSFNL